MPTAAGTTALQSRRRAACTPGIFRGGAALRRLGRRRAVPARYHARCGKSTRMQC